VIESIMPNRRRPPCPIGPAVLQAGRRVAGWGSRGNSGTPAACCIPAITPGADQGFGGSSDGTPDSCDHCSLMHGSSLVGEYPPGDWRAEGRSTFGTVTAGLVANRAAKRSGIVSLRAVVISPKKARTRTSSMMSPKAHPQVQGQEGALARASSRINTRSRRADRPRFSTQHLTANPVSACQLRFVDLAEAAAAIGIGGNASTSCRRCAELPLNDRQGDRMGKAEVSWSWLSCSSQAALPRSGGGEGLAQLDEARAPRSVRVVRMRFPTLLLTLASCCFPEPPSTTARPSQLPEPTTTSRAIRIQGRTAARRFGPGVVGENWVPIGP